MFCLTILQLPHHSIQLPAGEKIPQFNPSCMRNSKGKILHFVSRAEYPVACNRHSNNIQQTKQQEVIN
jgi:hypothetical protein